MKDDPETENFWMGTRNVCLRSVVAVLVASVVYRLRPCSTSLQRIELTPVAQKSYVIHWVQTDQNSSVEETRFRMELPGENTYFLMQARSAATACKIPPEVAGEMRVRNPYEQKCCQALTGAVYVETKPPSCVVPRILFLDNYFYCNDKSN
nr:pumilio homolog 23 [Tanacetum cinerariifolium]